MAWKFDKASKLGDANSWTAGDTVDILLVNNADPDNVLENTLTWTFDGSQSLAKFKAMVKQEIAALLKHLNQSKTMSDITPVLK